MKHDNTLQSLTLQLSDADPDTRARAAKLLALRGDERVLPALIDCLRLDAEPRVRAAAAHGLGQYGEPSLMELLLEALCDPSAIVRMAAVEALDPSWDSPQALAAVIAALEDPDPDVRRSAAWLLASQDPKIVLAPLKACLQRETDPGVHRVLVSALGGLADTRVKEVLSAGLIKGQKPRRRKRE